MMHGCGHDGHMAAVMGAALVLDRLRDSFAGSVRFVFQPGEEVAALGRDLVEAGALNDPEPDAVFALHGFHNLPVGQIASRYGAMMAAAGFFKIVIRGKGGHGSMPENAIDPILIGARVVESLQSIVSRSVSPADAVVVSVCRFSGGQNPNVIPDEVELEGTLRYLNPAFGEGLPKRIESIVQGICETHGASATFEYTEPYIPTINHDAMVDLGRTVAEEALGDEQWAWVEHSSMGGEDFSFYLQRHPGAFFRLGMGEGSAPLHNPTFDFNDDALPNAILFLTALTLRVLNT
jgi:amidohydrolase